MPLFEFKCDECGALIDTLQRWDDEPPDCVRCDGQMTKQVSKTTFLLKGQNWARDNYGLKSGGNG